MPMMLLVAVACTRPEVVDPTISSETRPSSPTGDTAVPCVPGDVLPEEPDNDQIVGIITLNWTDIVGGRPLPNLQIDAAFFDNRGYEWTGKVTDPLEGVDDCTQYVNPWATWDIAEYFNAGQLTITTPDVTLPLEPRFEYGAWVYFNDKVLIEHGFDDPFGDPISISIEGSADFPSVDLPVALTFPPAPVNPVFPEEPLPLDALEVRWEPACDDPVLIHVNVFSASQSKDAWNIECWARDDGSFVIPKDLVLAAASDPYELYLQHLRYRSELHEVAPNQYIQVVALVRALYTVPVESSQ